MLIIAAGLILFGGFSALMGFKIFRVMLPILGLITGVMIGFAGTQAVFGTGVVSTAIAITVAIVAGMLLSVLAFLFYGLAVTVLAITSGVSLFTFLGVALGLRESGFLLLLLAIAGGVVGLLVATTTTLTVDLVIVITSLVGVGYVLAGVFLAAGSLSLNDLQNNGIVASVADHVDQSFLWVFVWLGATLLASAVQRRTLMLEIFEDLQYKPAKSVKG